MNKNNLIILITAVVIMVLIVGFTFKDNLSDYLSNREELENDIQESIEIEEDEAINDKESDESERMKAPNFTLKTMDGKEASLEDYRGKIVFINFWATWCPYCVKEMPDLQRIYEENKDDLVILAVDVQESKGTVENYMKDKDYTFPILLDEKGEIASTYFISSYPTTYFVDKEGYLLGGYPGMLTYPQMNEILQSIRGN